MNKTNDVESPRYLIDIGLLLLLLYIAIEYWDLKTKLIFFACDFSISVLILVNEIPSVFHLYQLKKFWWKIQDDLLQDYSDHLFWYEQE